ncbi:MAG TPA: hypothetical protein VN608_08645 [Clostridia bacterium]|nr:hypothetical protein [Clostridia bacterium]
MIERYKDFYGCTATIRPTDDGFKLLSRTPQGKKIRDQVFKTHRGAVRAMQNDADGGMERIDAKKDGMDYMKIRI